MHTPGGSVTFDLEQFAKNNKWVVWENLNVVIYILRGF